MNRRARRANQAPPLFNILATPNNPKVVRAYTSITPPTPSLFEEKEPDEHIMRDRTTTTLLQPY